MPITEHILNQYLNHLIFFKINDNDYLSILNIYSKLINNNLQHYFHSFKPQFANGVSHYNLRNPSMHLPIIKHKFPKQSLRYKLITISTYLNEMSAETMGLPMNNTQKRFVDFVRNNKNRNTCADPRNCYTCNNS